MRQNYINRVYDHLFKYGFTQNLMFPLDEIEAYLEENFRIEYIELIEEKRFNANELFKILEPLFDKLVPQAPECGWMTYFYQYTLKLNFQEATTISFTEEHDHIAMLYLRILHIFCKEQIESDDGSWQSKYPIELLADKEIRELEDPIEYITFKERFENDYVYEMMKLNQDVIGYSTLNHICGVHHIAMKVARQLSLTGMKVDIGRVSGAAIGHDLGKYGCKPDEMKRVAYYHYFYTGQWFERRNIVYIRNVAINHSTWDLELEALPIESLILIYADFRVKAVRENGQKFMRYFTLKDSFDVILEKLDNVDQAKENRYKKVYMQLEDFENYLLDMGVVVTPDDAVTITDNYSRQRKYFSLMQGDAIVDNMIYAAIERNVNILYRFRNERSLNRLLEPVRSSRDITLLRGYIRIIEQYYNYLTQKQKMMVVNFFYDKLVIKEEDVRKDCAALIGKILATYDEEIRKETPPSIKESPDEVTSLSNFKEMVERILSPESKVIDRHRAFVSYSLRDFVEAYFKTVKEEDTKEEAIEWFVNRYRGVNDEHNTRFYLLKALRVLPFKVMTDHQIDTILDFVTDMMVSDDMKLKLRAYNAIFQMAKQVGNSVIRSEGIIDYLKSSCAKSSEPAINFGRFKMAELLSLHGDVVESYRQFCLDDLNHTSDIFLNNLKTATLDIAKRFQIELLMRNTILYDYDNCFYTAMHLCNLLKVSALETVRNTAGRGLLDIVPHLTFAQKNDILVELIRALEMENYEFTKYIPEYLGRLMLHVKPKELDELLAAFEEKLHVPGNKLVALIVKTIGITLSNYTKYRHAFPQDEEVHEQRILKMFGIVFTGFVHSSKHVNLIALDTLTQDIFMSKTLTLEEKNHFYNVTIKKIMSLTVNTDETNDLILFNNAASLKQLYHFVNELKFEKGDTSLIAKRKIAFFPGSFDPFTLSHKEIAKDIRDQGFEVLLYIDEFSWSKRTQPNIIRRNIIKRSVASEVDIYPFPRDISINISNNKDLDKLMARFPESKVFMVVGSDVVMNASAYREHEKSATISTIPHLVFYRPDQKNKKEYEAQLQRKFDILHKDSRLMTLTDKYKDISSSLIREYIDNKRDISSMIEPLAQSYIYDKKLYQKEPTFKSVMTVKSVSIEIYEQLSEDMIYELAQASDQNVSQVSEGIRKASEKLAFKVVVLRNLNDRHIIGYVLMHWLRASEIHNEIHDEDIVEQIREDYVGRILVVDSVVFSKGTDRRDAAQILFTEALANALGDDFSYCVYHENIFNDVHPEVVYALKHQGFVDVSKGLAHEHVYVVNMTSPVTVNLDIKSMIKEPFRNHPQVLEVIYKTRERILEAIVGLYPGNLVVNFDRAMIYENLITKVCRENHMPTTPLKPKTLGKAMCVPFGAVFNRWLLPNTVTKTLHAEKYFSPDLSELEIKESPFFLDIENQAKMIKSFDRPVILVDDLLNKGYRLKALMPYIRRQELPIQKLIVAVMSASGKAVAEGLNIDVDSAYFIPKIKVWFYESNLYPFLGGDAIWRGNIPDSRLINSVNLILPYSSASYIKGASRESVYNLSKIAIENSMDIMRMIETVYANETDRMLTISRLGEVLNIPRYPDKGKFISYDENIRPSEYLKGDLEQLHKLHDYYTR